MIDRTKINVEMLVEYLTSHQLVITTAESCTAGTISSMLSDIEGCGRFLDSGFVTYSRESKEKLLGVKASTIEKYTLTSEEVAHEMANGALSNGLANVAVACTGVAGPAPMDGVPPGRVCIAWAFQLSPDARSAFSHTANFQGDRNQIRKQAAMFAINGIVHFHQKLLCRQV